MKRRKQWGSCAGVALVRAGGGRVTLLDGSPVQFNHSELRQPQPVVAAGASLQPMLLDIVRAVERQQAKPVSTGSDPSAPGPSGIAAQQRR
jgi:3'-phosphoadenosine 5'-phosphosulfate (PAPS) 3'-phosphatase